MSRAPDIAKLHAKRDVKGLIKALAYPGEVTVRVNAARALGELGDPRAVEPLVAMLQNKQHFVAEPLARLGDPRAVEPLIAALGEDRYGGVARALGMLRDPRAVGPSSAPSGAVSGRSSNRPRSPWERWATRAPSTVSSPSWHTTTSWSHAPPSTRS